MIVIHLYFNLLKLPYSFIGRRDLYFILFESLGSLVLILFLFFWGNYLADLFQKILPVNKLIANFVFPLICGLLFILTSVLARLLVIANPEEVAERKNNNSIVSVGIVDFSWLTIMGAVYTAVLYCSNLEVACNIVQSNHTPEYYRMYYDEIDFMFGKSIDMILLLGSILAICMSILWGG